MSNIFQEVLKDATGVEQNLLGPDYPYWQNIKNPRQNKRQSICTQSSDRK